VSWLTPAPTLVEQPVRTQLAQRYAVVRLATACVALPLSLTVSLVSGRLVGFECAVVITALLIHALIYLRRHIGVAGALAVDATVVGLIALIVRLPVAAGMGSAFLAVTINVLAQGWVRRWLLAYVAAWLLAALAAALAGGGAHYSGAMLHLLTTLTIVFFLTSIAAVVMMIMGELDRRDRARSEASRLLQDSEERFRTLVQEAFDAVVVTDARGHIQYASESYERVTGFSRSDRLEASMGGRIHPDDVPGGRETIDRARRNPGETFRYRLRARREEGGWRSLELAVTNLLHNPAVAGMVCNLCDVTEQVQAEEALRASEHRFRGAFENAPIGMALLNLDGTFLQVNPALADLLGYSPESLLSMNWNAVDAPQEPDTAAEIAALLAGGTPSRHMERRQVRADGSTRECTVNLSVVGDAHQRPHHLIMQLVDITDPKRTQRDLEQALRGKDEFVASVSHELRTPLTAVIGFGDLLRARPSPLSAQEQQETIEVMTAQAAEMARIVEDLLVVARSDAGEIRVASVPVDLRTEAAQVLDGWGPADVAHIVLEETTERARADPSRVRQILRNLILNALRYGGEHVRIGTRRASASACIVVADDGPGIPDDARERAFEPYQQAHQVPGLTSSIGIGLTVSRRLARLMGGDLKYRYEKGEAIFELALPAVEAPAEPEAPHREAQVGNASPGPLPLRRPPARLTQPGRASRAGP
jgi:PAS domain S-box-containing protein